MNKLKEYRKVRRGLEFVASLIAVAAGIGISSYFGIYGKKFFSLETALSTAIIVGISVVLSQIAIKIADHWYAKNKE